MTDSRLQQAIKRYQTAVEQLKTTIDASTDPNHIIADAAQPTQPEEVKQQLTRTQILEVFTARDEVQAALADTMQTSGESLAAIAQLDKILKDNATAIATIRDTIDWQTSFNPPKEAWWWSLQPERKPHKFWDQLDWFWSAVSISSLTISLGLVGDISSRFLTGGPDTLGALAVSTQSILTLLTAGGALTLAGQESYKRTLNRLKIPERFWQEISAGFSLLLVIGLLGLRLSLPQIAILYRNWGYKNFVEHDLGSAERNYQRAIKLNPDDALAHFRLGVIYEELQRLDLARTEYQIAAQDNIPDAINNLSRLYILNKNYPPAVNLLLKVLADEHKLKPSTEAKYALLKNLGWARLMQGNYPDAEAKLLEAIDLQISAKVTKNIASPYCLLAQVMEAKKDKKGALKEWETCIQYADIASSTDEDGWVITAQKRLAEQENKK
ncbi:MULTISPECIES: tetratricopeptide repeat protein [unclassified Nostoc]|uniref:tetratricopeptide repeat protein n=1 Tax=unclassified Nostoc TaxID=2593658 RepID=UPI001E127672|nr:tetratricopeptide repeat protein [Nostoc sp. JL23]MBN3875715.1 tetratricopeptide repeat protein [Nostoc sp. JL23]